MNEKLSLSEINFLRAIKSDSIPPKTPSQDAIRQKLRKEGYCEILKNPRRWSLTDKGIQYLQSL